MRTVADRDRHLRRLTETITDRLAAHPADLVVLPELSSVYYGRETWERLDEFAEPLDGPSFSCLSDVSRRFGSPIVYGMPRRGDHDYHIAQVVIGSGGELVGYYDKLHMAQFGASEEKSYFRAGDHLLVFEHNGLTIAPIICYDIRVPELMRLLTLSHGVDLVLHCGAYARDESFASWHPFVVSRAMENQIYLLSLNRAGDDYGSSLFCPPWVSEETPAIEFPEHDEALRYLEVDTRRISQVRERYSFLGDRFSDYGALDVQRARASGGSSVGGGAA